MQPEPHTQRETLRVRTTMSYAFEGALRGYASAPASEVTPLVRTAAEALSRGFRNIPAWTVSKRDEKATKGRKRR